MTRAVQLPPHSDITERDFQRQVQDVARLYGWTTYHPWLSVHSERGWPDLALVRPPRLVLAELKSDRGKLTAAQERWLGLLGRCAGIQVEVWRPADLPGRVLEVLR